MTNNSLKEKALYRVKGFLFSTSLLTCTLILLFLLHRRIMIDRFENIPWIFFQFRNKPAE